MKIIRVSDLHIAFLGGGLDYFLKEVARRKPDAVVLTGDIGEGSTLEKTIAYILGIIQVPLYFILGNHDYYKASFDYSDELSIQLMETFSTKGIEAIYLDRTTTKIGNCNIVGVNGYADGRAGNIYTSGLFNYMNDFRLIGNFIGVWPNRDEVLKVMQEQADLSSEYMKKTLPTLTGRTLIFTHVPPWPEACVSRHGDGETAWPFYVNKKLGETIEDFGKHLEIEVYCGHTHRKFQGKIADNIWVSVSGSDYGNPEIEEIIV